MAGPEGASKRNARCQGARPHATVCPRTYPAAKVKGNSELKQWLLRGPSGSPTSAGMNLLTPQSIEEGQAWVLVQRMYGERYTP